MKWKPLKSVDFLVVHCSQTKDNLDIGVEEIRRTHRQKGWMDIGFHRVIRRDGTVEQGRPMNAPGAHARGYNHVSLGYCLVGTRDFTDAQYASLRAELEDQLTQHPDADVVGYGDLPKVNSAVPNFDVTEWWAAG